MQRPDNFPRAHILVIKTTIPHQASAGNWNMGKCLADHCPIKTLVVRGGRVGEGKGAVLVSTGVHAVPGFRSGAVSMMTRRLVYSETWKANALLSKRVAVNCGGGGRTMRRATWLVIGGRCRRPEFRPCTKRGENANPAGRDWRNRPAPTAEFGHERPVSALHPGSKQTTTSYSPLMICVTA